MLFRTRFESSDDVGVFACLTNAYCLVAPGSSENFYSVFEQALANHIPVVQTSIGGSRVVGRLCVGNRHGLIVPDITTDEELQHLRNSLPDSVKVVRVEERLSALGNCAVCNDHVAILHPELSRSTEEVIRDTLRVQTFRTAVAESKLVGSNAVLTNKGCLVYPGTRPQEMDELSSLLQVPVAAGSVNRGQATIAAGVAANDWCAFCGLKTTATELTVLERIFRLRPDATGAAAGGAAREGNLLQDVRDALIDDLA